MEVVGAYRIFERSNVRIVQYNEYYGDGDSKGYESVKNFYGINTNYYGIATRSNVGNLQKMSSVKAAFFHCVSGKNNSLHGQCPEGSESWCRYQRAKAAGSPLKEIEQGSPNKIINQIKPTYLKLYDETLLKKCLHDMSRRKQRSAFDQVPEFDRGSIVAYQDCELSFRKIVRMAVQNRSVTSRTIAQHIESVTHYSVSADTIRRRLQQSGFVLKTSIAWSTLNAEQKTSPPPMVTFINYGGHGSPFIVTPSVTKHKLNQCRQVKDGGGEKRRQSQLAASRLVLLLSLDYIQPMIDGRECGEGTVWSPIKLMLQDR
ncbi:uncharacterized protein LOC101238613 [Trichonephila clavipes]|nr:uncharacterized protein LOC101238613 [Trichonephila clavipes]